MYILLNRCLFTFCERFVGLNQLCLGIKDVGQLFKSIRLEGISGRDQVGNGIRNFKPGGNFDRSRQRDKLCLNADLIQVFFSKDRIARSNPFSVQLFRRLNRSVFGDCDGESADAVLKTSENGHVRFIFRYCIGSDKTQVTDAILYIFRNIIVTDQQKFDIKVEALDQEAYFAVITTEGDSIEEGKRFVRKAVDLLNLNEQGSFRIEYSHHRKLSEF